MILHGLGEGLSSDLAQLPLACREIIHVRASEESGHGCLRLWFRVQGLGCGV